MRRGVLWADQWLQPCDRYNDVYGVACCCLHSWKLPTEQGAMDAIGATAHSRTWTARPLHPVWTPFSALYCVRCVSLC